MKEKIPEGLVWLEREVMEKEDSEKVVKGRGRTVSGRRAKGSERSSAGSFSRGLRRWQCLSLDVVALSLLLDESSHSPAPVPSCS